MPAILSPNFRQQFFDANGVPLAGGKVYSYAAGSSTPQMTYTDQSGATPNANPTILDASGVASIWLGSANYKIVITDASDVTIETIDQVNGNLTAATNGIDGKSLRSGSGAPTSGVGNDGDFYINTTGNNIYGPKASGAWPSGVSIVGPTGATGATGATGSTGAQGVPGASGTAIQERLTGTFSGGNTTYTPSQTPTAAEEVFAVLGAVPQLQGTDYTISGTTITFASQDTSAISLLVFYRH